MNTQIGFIQKKIFRPLIYIIAFCVIYFLQLLNGHSESIDILLGLNLMAGSINGKFSEYIRKRLSVISVLINNLCNLKCKHCYLQARKNDEYLSPKEWNRFFFSLLSETRPETLCFAGKEVFFDKHSADIFFDAVNLRNRVQQYDHQKTEIGVITNGTLIHQHRTSFLETPPDYIDISIDGLPDEHNLIRGNGAFESMEKNLHWLMAHFTGNIWITHTVMSHNLESLPEFIRFIHSHFGVTRFSIGLYKETTYTDNRLKLDQESISSLFQKTFHQLGQLQLNKPVEIILEMDYTQTEFLPHLIRSGWVDSARPFSSISHRYDNDLRLTVNSANIPVGLWRAVRVTPEGFWLAAEDLMEVKRYNEVETARLRSFHFDSEAIYKAGLQSDRFRQLFQAAPLMPDTLKKQFLNLETPELQANLL